MRALRSRLVATILGCCAVLMTGVQPVGAHPLGNTSVNLYERIEIASDEIRIRFVLDVSEIPAVKEKEFADSSDDGIVDATESNAYLDGLWVYIAPKLILVVNDTPLLLTPVRQTLSFPPGQGGLTLLRAVYDITAAHPAGSSGNRFDATLTETTFEGVPGWHEVVVRAADGASVVESSAPAVDITNELTVYPADRINNMLAVRQANFRYALDSGAIAPSAPASPAQGGANGSVPPTPMPAAAASQVVPLPGSGAPPDPLVALVGPNVSLLATLAAVVIAMGLGAFHALSPGHGKTLVAAYLIGTRANLRQGLGLGLTVAVTHTAGVLVLGVATYFATEWVVPDRVVSWLSVSTGALVIILGAILVWRSWRTRLAAGAHGHSHDLGPRSGHNHDHGGGHTHDRGPSSSRGRRRRTRAGQNAAPASAVVSPTPVSPALRHRDVAALGIVGGLIPSGSALLLLLSSIALGQTALGVVLILAFGVGMALILAGISTGVVLMRRSPVMGWERWRSPRLARFTGLVPVFSGVVVIAFGALLTYDSLQAFR